MKKSKAKVSGYIRENPNPIIPKSHMKLATMMVGITRRGKPNDGDGLRFRLPNRRRAAVPT